MKDSKSEGAGTKQGRLALWWDRAIGLLEALAQQRHVLALRDGMIASVPVILVGSTFLLFGCQSEVLRDYFSGNVSWLPNLVDTRFGQWYLQNTALMLLPYRVTMGALALYIAFTIASALATQYKMSPVQHGLGAVAALFITGTPVRVAITENGSAEWVLPLKPLGPEGIFLGIVVAVAMVEISRLFMWGQHRPEAKAPEPSRDANVAGASVATGDAPAVGASAGEGDATVVAKSAESAKGAAPAVASQDEPASAALGDIPPSVLEAFRSFLPMLSVVALVWCIRHAAGCDLQAGILALMQPMTSLGDSLAAVVISNAFMHTFAVAGVHGISVINAVMLPLWQQYVAANAEAHAAGLPLPHVTAYPFYQWFVWMGGAGATLAPTIMILFSSNARMKSIGKIAIVPALFNVNEPFLFGLPVVANPILAIPCIVAPVVCGVVAWFAVSWGIVSPPFIEVPWVLPCFLGALLSTQDLRSLLLLLVNFVLSGLIWYPFLRAYRRGLERGH